jgi:uncharacterized membrane protein YgcG
MSLERALRSFCSSAASPALLPLQAARGPLRSRNTTPTPEATRCSHHILAAGPPAVVFDHPSLHGEASAHRWVLLLDRDRDGDQTGDAPAKTVVIRFMLVDDESNMIRSTETVLAPRSRRAETKINRPLPGIRLHLRIRSPVGLGYRGYHGGGGGGGGSRKGGGGGGGGIAPQDPGPAGITGAG